MADQQLNEKQLQALLRLKRYEQPPPGYFDDLLSSIHQRQREELLRRPAWRLSLERVKTFFQSLRVDWRYAGTMASILLMGIGMIQLALPRQKTTITVAATQPAVPQVMPVAYEPALTLEARSPQGPAMLPPLQRVIVSPRPGSQPAPQFVGGSLPASYEPTQIRF